MGASPDGLLKCKCNRDGVLEVKINVLTLVGIRALVKEWRSRVSS